MISICVDYGAWNIVCFLPCIKAAIMAVSILPKQSICEVGHHR